jgi:tripartite-type tricarboxylate transporter receptor subunit TctC
MPAMRAARTLPALLVAVAALFSILPAHAEDYPARAITLVVPYPAGGSIDLVAREIGHKLHEAWGQPVVIQNVGGASGNIGSAQVARAAPDGYTLLLTTNAPLVLNQFVLKAMPFDAARDFEPVILATLTPIALVVHSSLPVTTLPEFVAFARRNPGKIGFASSGTGSPHHMAGEMLKTAAGIDIRHVPYRGAAPAINDVVAGHVQSGFITLGTILPFAKRGEVRVLAVIEDERSDLAPDVPMIGETVAGYRRASTGWHAFLAPRGTPGPITAKLNERIEAALADPEVKAKLHVAGILTVGGAPGAVTNRIKAEVEVVRALFANSGIVPE